MKSKVELSTRKKATGENSFPYLMKYYQGYSISDISQISGMGSQTVKKRLKESGICFDKHNRLPHIYMDLSAVTHVYPYNLIYELLDNNYLDTGPVHNLQDQEILFRVYIPDVLQSIENLDEIRKFVIEKRFLEGKSNQDIGSDLGVSREYIRQCLENAEMQIGEWLSNSIMLTQDEIRDMVDEMVDTAARKVYMQNNKIKDLKTFYQTPIDCVAGTFFPWRFLQVLKGNHGIYTFGDIAAAKYRYLCMDKELGKAQTDSIVHNFKLIGIRIDTSQRRGGINVSKIGLSARAQHALTNNGVLFLNGSMAERDLRQMQGIGPKVAREVAQKFVKPFPISNDYNRKHKDEHS